MVLFGEQGLDRKKSVEQEKDGDHAAGEGIFAHRAGEQIHSRYAEQGAQGKITHRFEDGPLGSLVKLVALVFQLPSPAQNVVGLPDPGDQPLVFHQAGLAIHALGIGIAVGETATQTEFGVGFLMQ